MKKEQQGFTLIELMIVTAIIGVLVSVAMPAYQDYTIRTQISEGLSLSAVAKVALTEYYAARGAWPNNNNKAGLANHNDIRGKYVKSVKVKDNVLEIMYGYDAHKSISNKKIILTAVTNLGIIKWTCASAGIIEANHLPSGCR